MSQAFTAVPVVADLAWLEVQAFCAYGLRCGLQSNDAAALQALCAAVLPGWQAAPPGPLDLHYVLYVAGASGEQPAEQRLYYGSELLASAQDRALLLQVFREHAEAQIAYRARDVLFVHAGVVGWRGQAIMLPGRSFSGKSRLVAALVEAGASYYSDEFGILDRQGLVHAYPSPLMLRSADGQSAWKTPLALPGPPAAESALPLGLLVVTQYQAGASWRPRRLSAGRALLALMDNSVAARREPQYSMPILREAVLRARSIQSKRGEAQAVAAAILRQVRD